jgi:hypothetical protein
MFRKRKEQQDERDRKTALAEKAIQDLEPHELQDVIGIALKGRLLEYDNDMQRLRRG